MIFKNFDGHIMSNDHSGHPLHPPANPGHPDKPERPDHPQHPGHPEKPEHPSRPITVIVNGVDKELPAGILQLSYEDVVKLAEGSYVNSPNVIYTVAYNHGPVENRRGVLVKGASVFVKDGMVFNVGRSDKS